MRVLKLKTAIDLHACEEQVEEFRKLWGEQVEVTEEVFIPVAQILDWNWCGENLLAWESRTEFSRGLNEIVNRRRDKFSAARDALYKECNPSDAAYKKRDEAFQEARRMQNMEEAQLFARLYIADGQREHTHVWEPAPPSRDGYEFQQCKCGVVRSNEPTGSQGEAKAAEG